ncbi:MAG: AMP-binding protein [Alphaproteobacteria bacterium]|jgi:acyl-CoA synthetase (AMP-forming)/AMP-acid ligase II|nr:AMP-binding protein [Alphaproteobacteria bacterium]
MRFMTSYGRTEYQDYYAKGYWRSETFPEALRANVRAMPDKIAMVHGGRRLSHAELFTQTRQAAAGLHSLGVGPGDVVSLQLPNSIELVVAILAVWELGAVYNPLNPGYRRHEVAAIAGAANPVALICPRDFAGFDYPTMIEESLGEAAGDTALIAVGGAPGPGWRGFDELLALGESQLAEGWRGPATWDADAVFLIGATSGTTGAPKLYMHTTNSQLQEARMLNRELGFSDEDVFLAVAPLTHRGAMMYGLLTALAAGATLVLADAFVPAEVLELFEGEGVTAFMAIPTLALDLLAEFERRPRDVHRLHRAMLSGAPLTDDLIERFTRTWPDCVPVSGYGLSETGYCTFLRPGDPLDKLRTSGRLAPGIELRIRTEDGEAAAVGEVGEILLRGWMVCAGYFDNQQVTAQTIDDQGWFATGDLGVLDADGYLQPVGRLKHMIIRGGLNIFAEELEHLLLQHPAIVGAVVIGVPDARLGERACACLVLRPGESFAIADTRQFFHELGLAKYKWPEFIVPFDSFPLNPVGKLDRRSIAETALALLASLRKAGLPE